MKVCIIDKTQVEFTPGLLSGLTFSQWTRGSGRSFIRCVGRSEVNMFGVLFVSGTTVVYTEHILVTGPSTSFGFESSHCCFERNAANNIYFKNKMDIKGK